MQRNHAIAHVGQGMITEGLSTQGAAQFAVEFKEQLRPFAYPITIDLAVKLFEHVEQAVLAAIAVGLETNLICSNNHTDIAIDQFVEIDPNTWLLAEL